MTGPTVVVTDSTACLAPKRADGAGIVVVPLQVVIGTDSYTEGTPEARSALLAALRRRQPATTSRPSPEQFAACYRELAERGAGGIVSVHLSEQLSATGEAARLAAKGSQIPVEVVDSHSLAMGLGYAALSAAECAETGAGPVLCADAAARRAAATSILFYVDTLEYLRRGGRIGKAQAFVGSALAVKPLLHLLDGQVAPLEKVRTAARALARIEQIALERAGDGPVDVAVHHLNSLPRAELLAEQLRGGLPGLGELTISEVGAVIGAHAGPGVLGVVISPRPAA
jgi:DegV family protein with EDD domain